MTPASPASTGSASIASRLGAPLAQARLRFSGSAVQQFLAWWGGELMGVLPARWQALFAQARARVVYVADAEDIELRLEEGAGEQVLGRLARDVEGEPSTLSARADARLGAARVERPRWLLLPAGQVLQRKISLPAAATERLRAVVAHELDRQTPFRADQVSYDCRVLAVDQATRMAQVELLVLPKDRLDAALAGLGPLAAGLSGVDARDHAGRALRCNLLPVERRKPADRRSLWIDLGLAAVVLIVLGFALGQTLDNRRAEVERLQTQVDRLHAQARKVTALNRQLDAALAGANFLAARRAEQPTMLAVLADVSGRIPDNTFLERFSQQDGQIYLTGLSTDAASLVAKLQGSPLLKAPALTGSVQPDAAAKRDRFTLTATLVGHGKPVAGASAQPASATAQEDDRAASP